MTASSASSASSLLKVLLLASLSTALAGTNAFGKKFLAENKLRDGVVTLPSGLQYKVLTEGEGDAHPLPDAQCSCHYEGRTAQEWSKEPKGKKFDSSYDRGDPTSFAPSGVVAGTARTSVEQERAPSAPITESESTGQRRLRLRPIPLPKPPNHSPVGPRARRVVRTSRGRGHASQA